MKYNELSEEAKETARDEIKDGLDYWSESVIDDWKTLLGKLGFCDVKIYWSGFWSQGDGACFAAQWSVDWMQLDEVPGYTSEERAKELVVYPETVQGLYKLLSEVVNEDEEGFENPIVVGASLEHRGNYYHEHSIDYTFDTGAAYPTSEAEGEFKDWCKDLMRMIYKDLEAEYEYQMSDESIVEMIEANEYDFNEEGEMK
jgi:hypothetical protein